MISSCLSNVPSIFGYHKATCNQIINTCILKGNGTPPLCDVLPLEINNKNYFLLIGFICNEIDNFPLVSVV